LKMRKVGKERYAYSFFGSMFRWVAFRSGILLLAPAQETAKVDPAHVVSGCDSVSLLLHAGAACLWAGRRWLTACLQ
jgi:hypothetical protein